MGTTLIKTEHQPDGKNKSGKREKDLIERYLLSFIEPNETYRQQVNENEEKWIDYETSLRYLTLNFIVKNFSLYELWLIFTDFEQCYFLDQHTISTAKREAIQNINRSSYLTQQEVKRLKKKVWDMNPILFGLTLQLIYDSDLFWDIEEGCWDFHRVSKTLWKPAEQYYGPESLSGTSTNTDNTEIYEDLPF